MFDAMREYMTASVKSGKPFFLLFYTEVSHMALEDAYKAGAATLAERFVRSYRILDVGIRALLAMLEELNVLRDAVIVGYGDHGDEFWSHDLNRGYCHCIPPYASQVWTPFFIYDNGENARDVDTMLSTPDMAHTLIRKLIPGYVPDKAILGKEPPFQGSDAEAREDGLIFSQNLFPVQLEYDDPEKGLKKGYSVTDGVYRLVVTSDGDRRQDGGLELFYDRLDPFNSRNLLNFFTLNGKGEIAEFRPPPEATGSEFDILFNSASVEHLIRTYDRLRAALRDFVRRKEEVALPFRTGENFHLMSDRSFSIAKKRVRKD